MILTGNTGTQKTRNGRQSTVQLQWSKWSRKRLKLVNFIKSNSNFSIKQSCIDRLCLGRLVDSHYADADWAWLISDTPSVLPHSTMSPVDCRWAGGVLGVTIRLAWNFCLSVITSVYAYAPTWPLWSSSAHLLVEPRVRTTLASRGLQICWATHLELSKIQCY
jgi:hypothetical protein